MLFATELDCFKNPELLDPDGNHISVHTMKARYFPSSIAQLSKV
jgi:hypothetical protein